VRESDLLVKYLRVSLDDGNPGDSDSIEGQRALLDDFVANSGELKDIACVEIADDGYSGTNFDRPGVRDLLEKARRGEVGCIVVKDFSRFGRNYIDVGDYLEQIFP
jgi:DNA invertase Pin-like site-specific DNA recombinase